MADLGAPLLLHLFDVAIADDGAGIAAAVIDFNCFPIYQKPAVVNLAIPTQVIDS